VPLDCKRLVVVVEVVGLPVVLPVLLSLLVLGGVVVNVVVVAVDVEPH